MPIFKAGLRIIAAHRRYALIYLVLISSLGLVIGLVSSQNSSTELADWTPRVAVIDRDGSELSAGLSDFLASEGEVQELEDSTRAIQDAVAGDRINYILVIPAGFGEQMHRAFEARVVAGDAEAEDAAGASGGADASGGPKSSGADAASEAPRVETAISYASARGAFIDLRVNDFLDQVSDHLRIGATAADSVAAAREASAKKAPGELLDGRSDSPSDGFILYARFSLYPIFAFVVVTIMMVMIALNRRSIRSRLAVSPASSPSTNLGLLGVSGVVGLIAWLWIMLLALVFFAPLSSASGIARTGIVSLALLAYCAVAVAVAYLLGQLGWGENAANGFANLAGMLLSFLGGAWVDLELLPEGIVTASKFTPAYWAKTAIDEAIEAPSVDWSALPALLAPTAVCALFAVAIMSVALMIRRSRARAEL